MNDDISILLSVDRNPNSLSSQNPDIHDPLNLHLQLIKNHSGSIKIITTGFHSVSNLLLVIPVSRNIKI